MEYIIRQELVDGSMDVSICLVHIFVDLELIVDHFCRWKERKGGVQSYETWVRRGYKRQCVDEREDGRLLYHAHPPMLRVVWMGDLFNLVYDV